MSTIVIDNFAALHAFLNIAPDKDTRYYLNGVLIQATRKETRIVATDGHKLAAYRMSAQNDISNDDGMIEFIIPRDTLKMIKPSRQIKFATIESGEGEELFINYAGAKVSFNPIDGVFPDYSRVIPREFTDEIAQFNVDYLMAFQKTAHAIHGNKKGVIVIKHNGNNGASLVDIGDDDFMGLIMPLRTNDRKPSVDWARTNLKWAIAKKQAA